jgi:hypothetical protein
MRVVFHDKEKKVPADWNESQMKRNYFIPSKPKLEKMHKISKIWEQISKKRQIPKFWEYRSFPKLQVFLEKNPRMSIAKWKFIPLCSYIMSTHPCWTDPKIESFFDAYEGWSDDPFPVIPEQQSSFNAEDSSIWHAAVGQSTYDFNNDEDYSFNNPSTNRDLSDKSQQTSIVANNTVSNEVVDGSLNNTPDLLRIPDILPPLSSTLSSVFKENNILSEPEFLVNGEDAIVCTSSSEQFVESNQPISANSKDNFEFVPTHYHAVHQSFEQQHRSTFQKTTTVSKSSSTHAPLVPLLPELIAFFQTRTVTKIKYWSLEELEIIDALAKEQNVSDVVPSTESIESALRAANPATDKTYFDISCKRRNLAAQGKQNHVPVCVYLRNRIKSMREKLFHVQFPDNACREQRHQLHDDLISIPRSSYSPKEMRRHQTTTISVDAVKAAVYRVATEMLKQEITTELSTRIAQTIHSSIKEF